MARDKFKEVVDRLWPKTKKELERAINTTKKLLNKGEEYLKDVSEKGVDNARKLSLSLKKEKLYYSLGKSLAGLPKSKWSKSNKLSSLLKEIKDLEKDIKKKK